MSEAEARSSGESTLLQMGAVGDEVQATRQSITQAAAVCTLDDSNAL